MKELDVLRLLLARCDTYAIASVKRIQGRLYSLTLDGVAYRAVVLSRSFEFYEKRYHLAEPPPTLIVCFVHDTVVPVTVLSLRAGHLAQPYELPSSITDIERQRCSQLGSQVLLGMYVCGMRLAQQMIMDLPEPTRRRYLKKARALGKRARGKPVGRSGVPQSSQKRESDESSL